MKNFLAVSLFFLVTCLAACSDDIEPSPIPMQHWKEMDVRIETHPNPPQEGMSEIVVIVTGARGRPVHDLIVSLRADDAVPWVQTIQDGHIGAYRRGVSVGFGVSAVLQVQLRRGADQQILYFPLTLATGQR